ncbi:MAG TPA: TIGR02281 family clan AA aspartic protease [Hyphomicrobium sp.]
MFAMLMTVIVALGGAFLIAIFSGVNLETMQGPPIAITVIGALTLLYFLSVHGGERRMGRLPAIVACGVAAVLGVMTLRADPPALLSNIFAAARLDDDMAPPSTNGPASVRIRKTADGFLANSDVNGQAMPLLVDSGAATIVLRQSDAEKAGIDVRRLTFDTPLKTANGTSYLATVRLKSVQIGQLAVDDVEALVAKPGALNENLLGMSFLRRLASYQIAGDFITLRQ